MFGDLTLCARCLFKRYDLFILWQYLTLLGGSMCFCDFAFSKKDLIYYNILILWRQHFSVIHPLESTCIHRLSNGSKRRAIELKGFAILCKLYNQLQSPQQYFICQITLSQNYKSKTMSVFDWSHVFLKANKKVIMVFHLKNNI